MKLPFEEFGNGKPIILIHAFPLTGNMWKSQASILSENGFRVILPDLPGFGKNFETSKRYSIEEMALQISELINSLKLEKPIVGGLSMGGYVLFNLCRLTSDNFSGLIFCDTTFASDTQEKIRARFELISKIEKTGSAALIDEMLPKLISQDTLRNNHALTENLKGEFSKVDPTAAVNSLQSMAERLDQTEFAASITVPTLLLFGEFDQVTNLETAQEMNRIIPRSELLIIENAGHYSNLEQPGEFNAALLNFCKGIDY